MIESCMPLAPWVCDKEGNISIKELRRLILRHRMDKEGDLKMTPEDDARFRFHASWLMGDV
jgi:hypothetical protein